MEGKKTLYEVSKDLLSLQDLLDGCVDEDGNPREATEDELEQMKAWFTESATEFSDKFDNYCKFIKNQKIEAEIVQSEYKALKSEIDRLSKRSKGYEARAKTLQGLLQWNMSILHLPKFKSSFFTATVQKSPLTVEALQGAKLDGIPEEYLKPRELNTTAIKKAIKDGILETRETAENPLDRNKIFVVETGEALPNVVWNKKEVLVIR